MNEADKLTSATSFAVADIRPVGSADNPAARDLVIPVDGLTKPVLMTWPQGEYHVRVRMPDGESVNETVTVSNNAAPAILMIRSSEGPLRAYTEAQQVVTSVAYDTLSARSVRTGSKPAGSRLDAREGPRGSWSTKYLSHSVSNWVSNQSAAKVKFEQQGGAHKNFSLHRVRAEPDSSNIYSQSHGRLYAVENAVRRGFGSVVSVQPTRLKKSEGGEIAAWKVAQRAKKPKHSAGRYFSALVTSDSRGTQVHKVAPIPKHWLRPDGTKQGIQVRLVESKENSDVPDVQLTVDDPLARSLLQFLQSGDLNGALAMGRSRAGVEIDAKENPYLQVLEAYALVYSRLTEVQPGWEAALLSLSRTVTDIPDPKILEATLLLQRRVKPFAFNGKEFPPRDEKLRVMEAWEAIRNAMNIGPPMFRLGLRLLSENIRILQDYEGIPSRTKAQMRLAAQVVGNWRARVDPNQALCVFDVATL